MLIRIWSRHVGKCAIGLGLLGAAVYFVMISITLARIEALSGHVPFDMRPMGYSLSEAITILESLGADGRDYYLSRQIPLDMVYPGLLALTLITTIRWFGQRLDHPKLLQVGMLLSAAAAVFDYVENLGIIAIIWSWPVPSSALVVASSTATIAKSVSTIFAVTLVFAIGFYWLRQARANASS